MRPVDEGIINKYLPKLRLEWSRSQGFRFEILHEKVGNNRGEWGTHGNNVGLFLVLTFKAKKGRGEAYLYQFGCIQISDTLDHFNRFIDRDISEE